MDLLERPDVKSTYDKCKYIVKLWEHNFKKTKNRLPSRLDFREADQKVRDAYRKYYQLKTAALEQSFKDVEGFHSDEEQPEQVDDELNHTIAKDPDNESSKITEKPEIEPSTIQDELASDVWGRHLDSKPVEDKKPKKPLEPVQSKLTASLSQKLFCGSKLPKRNPRKSQSFSHRAKSDVEAPFLSQPTKSFNDSVEIEQNLSFEGLFPSNVKIGSFQEKINSQSTNIIHSLIDNKPKTLKSVDFGWLQRVGQSSGVEIEIPPADPQASAPVDNGCDESSVASMCLAYDSDDIIDNSDEESSFSLGHITKRPRLSLIRNKLEKSNSVSAEKPVETPSEQKEQQFPLQVQKLNMNPITEEQNNDFDLEPTKLEQVNFVQPDPFAFIEMTNEEEETTKIKRKVKRAPKTPKLSQKPQTPLRKLSARKTKAQISMAEEHSEEEDPFHSDNDSNDPEFTLNSSKDNNLNKVLRDVVKNAEEDEKITPKKPKPRTKKSPKKKPAKKAPEPEGEEAEEEDKYELEYSIKPRVSAPRFKNLKKLIKIETSSKAAAAAASQEKSGKSETHEQPAAKSKRQQDLDKLEKKIQAGNLNENFITINLKKKVYARGKKNFTFSKFKKQQWRNKKKALAGPEMDMGGCDGGTLTCFNCGQTGHFSRNCKNTKGDGLLPLTAALTEELCPYPTLEQAAQMAKESALAVRKPNQGESSQENAQEEDEDSASELFDDADTELLLAETLKLEEHVAKLDLQNYLDSVRVVKPYYALKEDGSLIETPAEVFSALKQFGHDSFRPGQEQAIMRILSGQSTLVTLSTGSGKSLCYQLPAYLYSKREPCISLIISPLVSLMEDQVTGIPSFLKAACLHTNKTRIQRDKIMEAISSGELDILLVSPEAVVAGEKSSGFGSLLRKLPPIAFACIDEAHCVSQWSHNFRPSYLMICRVLREKMGVKTVLGLTATATRSTSDSIISHLHIADGRNGIISDTPLPDNLVLTISKDGNRDAALINLLTSDRFSACRSIIIYCTRREECNRLTTFLRTRFRDEVSNVASKKRKRTSVQAEPYHAGLSASRRRTIQNAFMNGDLRIVVATVAFGMGINKPDIRSVIHYNMPKNFESYVQEIGRAGRDGLPAHCHLFLDARGNDENELRRHIHANSIDRHVIRKLLQKIFLPCSCQGTCPKHEVAFSVEETVRALDIPEENISTILCYLELHAKKYVELLSPAYTVCKVISYGGPLQIRKAAKECPPLAMALALQKKEGERETDQNVLQFAVVDIAAAIGWDSGICKHKLKNLEWVAEKGQAKRSPLSVCFSNLGFRLLAPGNLSDEELDEALDSLYEHVCNQEKTALLQLRAVHETLVGVAKESYRLCLGEEAGLVNKELKMKIREYFESPNPLEAVSLQEEGIVDEGNVVSSIHGLISIYRDNSFTGRAIARIFHGIQSPNYPAVIWGRCKYWRSHINVDFHTICRLATREILNFR